MPALDCPKCKSTSSWIEVGRVDTTQRCLCGYHRVIQTKLETATIDFGDVDERVSLPRTGSIMSKLLHLVKANEGASSVTIAGLLSTSLQEDRSVSDVSSYLTFLKSKGLVEPIEYRRGLAGGSTWKVTDPCKALLGG